MKNGIEGEREGGEEIEKGSGIVRGGTVTCREVERMGAGEEFEAEAKKRKAQATRERQQQQQNRSPLGMALGDSQAQPLASSIARLWLGTRITPKVLDGQMDYVYILGVAKARNGNFTYAVPRIRQYDRLTYAILLHTATSIFNLSRLWASERREQNGSDRPRAIEDRDVCRTR
jgi:hypothetical protein